jgi:hypothetical protein
MTQLQTNIFGGTVFTGKRTNEVETLIEKYPLAATNTGLFFFAALREHCPWVSQLPEERQNELRAYCRGIESLRRRRQEGRAHSRNAP